MSETIGCYVYLSAWQRNKIIEFCENVLSDGFEDDPEGDAEYAKLLKKVKGEYRDDVSRKTWQAVARKRQKEKNWRKINKGTL